jgi:hypothetical protein
VAILRRVQATTQWKTSDFAIRSLVNEIRAGRHSTARCLKRRSVPPFLCGSLQGAVPRFAAPFGYAQAGAESAGLVALENAVEGRPFSPQQVGIAGLLGPAFHGAFQAGSKALGALSERRMPMVADIALANEAAQRPVGGESVSMSIDVLVGGVSRRWSPEAGAFHLAQTDPEHSRSVDTGPEANGKISSHVIAQQAK